MSIEDKINKLEQELAELKASINQPKEAERWKPYKVGYRVKINNEGGEPKLYTTYQVGAPWSHEPTRTPELATLRQKQREAENELFNIWEHLVGDWRPDWQDEDQVKCHIGGIDLETVEFYSMVYMSPYRVFPSEELARRQYELASDHARAYMRGEF